MNEYNREEFAQYFKPTYLYIKRHKITGKKYFGKTIKDPLKYDGSGVQWKNHINYHGREHIETIWYQLFDDIDECRNYALKFSIDNNIVESEEWMNLILEDGIWMKPETRRKMSEAKKGKPGHRKGAKHTVEAKEKNRLAHLGKQASEETRAKMRASQAGKTMSAEAKVKIASTLTGVKHDRARVEKMRASNIGRTYPKVPCPNCGKQIAGQHMNRHKCKEHR